MYCTKCGREIDERMEFCPDCGAEIDIEISKVRDEVARGAIKFVTTAEMDAFSGNLYMTNYNNIYFVSNGSRETYLLMSKINNITRNGSRVFVEMKDGEEFIFDIQRDVDAYSLVKKTKWADQDDGVVYDDAVYEEDDSEYYEEEDEQSVKKPIIRIIALLVIVTCVWFGYKHIKEDRKDTNSNEMKKNDNNESDAHAAVINYCNKSNRFLSLRISGRNFMPKYKKEDDTHYYYDIYYENDDGDYLPMNISVSVSKDTLKVYDGF